MSTDGNDDYASYFGEYSGIAKGVSSEKIAGIRLA